MRKLEDSLHKAHDPNWRDTIIIPILKLKLGKDNTKPSIALTNCICKTMEQIVKDRLVLFLETSGILTEYQSCFRNNRSTIDQIIRSV